MKNIAYLILINLAIATVLFLALEGIIRITFPEIRLPGTEKSLIEENVYYSSPGLAKGAKGLSNGVVKYVDEKGFWKYSEKNSEPQKQLLFLGDSVTMGVGVESDSTFTGFILKKLNDINVINPSLIGYSSIDYLNIVETFTSQKRHNIDEVFIFWCLNDIYSSHHVKNSPGLNSNNLINNIIIFFRDNFKIYHFLKNLTTDRPESYYLFDKQFYHYDDKNFLNSINNLARIRTILKHSNIDLTVVLLPYEYQLRGDTTDAFVPQQKIKTKLLDQHISMFDVTPYMLQYNAPSKEFYLYGDGIHFSEYGHKIISEILIENNIIAGS